MKNRINNLWDNPSLPEDLRKVIEIRERKSAEAAVDILLYCPNTPVHLSAFETPCKIVPGLAYNNVGLFVGNVLATYLVSERIRRN